MTDPIEALVLFTIGWAAGVLTFCAVHMLRSKPPRQSNVFPMDRKDLQFGKTWPRQEKNGEIPF